MRKLSIALLALLSVLAFYHHSSTPQPTSTQILEKLSGVWRQGGTCNGPELKLITKGSEATLGADRAKMAMVGFNVEGKPIVEVYFQDRSRQDYLRFDALEQGFIWTLPGEHWEHSMGAPADRIFKKCFLIFN